MQIKMIKIGTIMMMEANMIRQMTKTLIEKEFDENNQAREYIEKTYRLLHDTMDAKWSYMDPSKKDEELNKRELIQTGEAGTRDEKFD